MSGITIDSSRGCLTIYSEDQELTLRGNGVALIALLIASAGWVTADCVHELSGWRGMRFESVGKQVARLLDRLKADGFDIIEWQGKTRCWRLRPEVLAMLDADTVAAARALVERSKNGTQGRFATVAPEAMARWALNSASASLAMTTGHADAGYAALRRAYAATDHPDLAAIADVLATRIGQRLKEPHAPVPGQLGGGGSVFELAVEARRIAAYAIGSASDEWEGQVKELTRLLQRMDGSASLTTRAFVLNALALLLRRLGHHDEALAHVQEAVPLAVFSGDYTLMQGVFFNFGNILSEIRRADSGAVPGADPLALLEMDLTIRRQFGLGKDSAQAELLLAYLAWEQDALDRAEAYLADAAAIIAINRSRADRALFHRVTGLVTISRAAGKHCPDGLKHLEEAIRLFHRSGNKASADYVRGELARLAGAMAAAAEPSGSREAQSAGQ